MRVTTAFNRLLSLPGVSVTEVCFEDERLVVDVALRRRRLQCPECTFSTAACSTPGRCSRVGGIPTWVAGRSWCGPVFAGSRARPTGSGSRPSRSPGTARVQPRLRGPHRVPSDQDRQDHDRPAVPGGLDSVGRICERVVADGLDPGRLDGLVNIGVDGVGWRKHHRYLTLVTDHTAKKIVWGAEGKDTATLDAFFDELDETRSAALQAISMDMGAAFLKSAGLKGTPRRR